MKPRPNPTSNEHRLGRNAVSLELGETICRLHSLLRQEFGVDFAYQITANGTIVAASNAKYGMVVPLLK